MADLQKQIASVKKQLGVYQTQLNKNDDEKEYDIIDAVLDEVEANEQKYQHSIAQNKQENKENKENKEIDDIDDMDDKPKKNNEFWKTLKKELKDGDIEFVKDLVRTKELSMDETDTSGRNLLMLATEFGLYELVSMCINLGADIDKMDNSKQTALKIATASGFLDIEELLRMNLLKTEVGKRIENTTNDLLKKRGITQNFYQLLNDIFSNKSNDESDEMEEKKEDDNSYENMDKMPISKEFLNALGENLKSEVLEVILKIIVKSIKNKIAYSNDMLHISFDYEMNRKNRLPTETILFKTIKKTILSILSDTNNKKDWYWLKTYILSSSIWYIKADPNDVKSQFLWYEIFKWVDNETKRQSKILSTPMKSIQDQNTSEWNKLITYNIETNYRYEDVRQDVIERGLKSEYTKEHLTQNVSLSAEFNPLMHYDLSQYLTKLVLVCHEIDDTFQNDIQRIFNVNKETKENKKLGVLYMRGPVKKLGVVLCNESKSVVIICDNSLNISGNYIDEVV